MRACVCHFFCVSLHPNKVTKNMIVSEISLWGAGIVDLIGAYSHGVFRCSG